MDNIDRIMKEADRLGFGCRYGKYRAAYPNGSADVLPSAKKTPSVKTVPCRLCGKMFVVKHGNQSYCSEDCRDEVFRQRQRELAAKKSKVPPVAMCVICGADFKPASTRSRYCCKECAKEGARKNNARLWAEYKKGRKNGVSV